jgi:DNA-3-methyladenine glycosylase I
VLKKRENYRKAFSAFDPRKVARFTPAKIERLLQDQGLIRNRAKVTAAVGNAKAFLAVQSAFGSFSDYLWRFVGGRTIVNQWRDHRDIPATTKESDAMAKDLKGRGFRFVGSTICYAHMQATGMVNDHLVGCFRYRACMR